MERFLSGKLLFSDMGRVLMSIVRIPAESRHVCGASNEKTNTARYGNGGIRAIIPMRVIDFFWRWRNTGWVARPSCEYQSVKIRVADGATTFIQDSSRPADFGIGRR